MQQMNLNITQALHRDHQKTLALLERLESDLNRQGVANPPDTEDGPMRSLLIDLAGVLEAEVKGHFAFEEAHLFPRFAEEINPSIPAMLRAEHGIIRPLAESIVTLARVALAQGFDADSWKAFRAQGLELVEREVFHVQKEEMGLLPALETIIDPSEDSELSMTYAEMGGNI